VLTGSLITEILFKITCIYMIIVQNHREVFRSFVRCRCYSLFAFQFVIFYCLVCLHFAVNDLLPEETELKVRYQPLPEGEVLGYLKRNQVIECLAVIGDWLQVRYLKEDAAWVRWRISSPAVAAAAGGVGGSSASAAAATMTSTLAAKLTSPPGSALTGTSRSSSRGTDKEKGFSAPAHGQSQGQGQGLSQELRKSATMRSSTSASAFSMGESLRALAAPVLDFLDWDPPFAGAGTGTHRRGVPGTGADTHSGTLRSTGGKQVIYVFYVFVGNCGFDSDCFFSDTNYGLLVLFFIYIVSVFFLLIFFVVVTATVTTTTELPPVTASRQATAYVSAPPSRLSKRERKSIRTPGDEHAHGDDVYQDDIVTYEINGVKSRIHLRKHPTFSREKIEHFNKVRYGSSEEGTSGYNLLLLPRHLVAYITPPPPSAGQPVDPPPSPLTLAQQEIFDHIMSLHNEDILRGEEHTLEDDRNDIFFHHDIASTASLSLSLSGTTSAGGTGAASGGGGGGGSSADMFPPAPLLSLPPLFSQSTSSLLPPGSAQPFDFRLDSASPSSTKIRFSADVYDGVGGGDGDGDGDGATRPRPRRRKDRKALQKEQEKSMLGGGDSSFEGSSSEEEGGGLPPSSWGVSARDGMYAVKDEEDDVDEAMALLEQQGGSLQSYNFNKGNAK
jgi:hypothetical protein